MSRSRTALLAVALALAVAPSVRSQSMALTVGAVEHPMFSIADAQVLLDAGDGGRAEVRLQRLQLGDKRYSDVRIRCPRLRLEGDRIDCPQGELTVAGAPHAALRFDFALNSRALNLEVRPAANESWQLRTSGAGGRVEARLENARLERLAEFVPQLAQFNLRAEASGTATLVLAPQRGSVEAAFDLTKLAFADSAGSRAGERVVARLELSASEAAGAWDWQARGALRGGEVYWQPWYWSERAVTLAASGTLDAQQVQVRSAEVAVDGIGSASGSATLARGDLSLREADLRIAELDLATAVPLFVAPLLEQAGAPKIEASGRLSGSATLREGTLTGVDLAFADASLAEAGGRYGVQRISGSIPWRRDGVTRAALRVGGASFGRLPIGAFDLAPELRGDGFSLARAELPVLDGKLVFEEVAARRGASGWSAQVGVALQPVSMLRLSEALGWPRMAGTLSASLPRVTHEGSTLKLEGALVIQVFDGFVSATNLHVIEPFGRLPRLEMDAEMQHVDLGQLTETFSFGNITGFVDGRVQGLQMAGWRPLRFDARIASSPGSYRKRISQRAVENISSLGGASAAAAIQRSFLRFFEEFGYDRIGLSCALRNGVCTMGGVEDAPQGYVIVKGGGVPAINVIGYNRRVDWEELVARLKRVTASGSRPVIQ